MFRDIFYTYHKPPLIVLSDPSPRRSIPYFCLFDRACRRFHSLKYTFSGYYCQS